MILLACHFYAKEQGKIRYRLPSMPVRKFFCSITSLKTNVLLAARVDNGLLAMIICCICECFAVFLKSVKF